MLQACATQQELDDSSGEDQREVMMVRRLNIKHSNYIWMNFTGTSLNVLTLIDSGAQVSVLPCKLYEKLPKEKQHPKSKSTVKIKAGNGTEIKCFGVAPVEFGFQGMTFVYNLYVVEDTVQPILGYDFMHDVGGSEISPSENTVKIRGKLLNLVTPADV